MLTEEAVYMGTAYLNFPCSQAFGLCAFSPLVVTILTIVQGLFFWCL